MVILKSLSFDSNFSDLAVISFLPNEQLEESLYTYPVCFLEVV